MPCQFRQAGTTGVSCAAPPSLALLRRGVPATCDTLVLNYYNYYGNFVKRGDLNALFWTMIC